ncbi:hypothetical protein D1007_03168 [Hordeum vulgare]|nr:hypothetical protein D1007_03168 [Hordeum vulgare]
MLECSLHYRLHQGATSRRGRVVERRKQVLPAMRAITIVARPGGLVHFEVAGVARVRAVAEDSWAGGGGLQRRVAAALVIPVAERVGRRAGEHAREVHDHGVGPDVAVGRHEGRVLGAVGGLVEGPRARAGALRLRVADPDVGRAGAGVGAVQAAPAHAEALHRHVLRREHHRDAAFLGFSRRGQGGDLLEGEGLAHGARAVGELVREQDTGALARAAGLGARGGEVLLVDGAPPLRDGRRGGLRLGGEREEEVEDHRLLRRLKVAVPEDGHGDVAVEHGAIVVGEHVGRVRPVQLHAPPRAHANLCRGRKHHRREKHCLCTNECHSRALCGLWLWSKNRVCLDQADHRD